MDKFINCYSNGNVTIFGVTIGDDFQHVMEVASMYNGNTDMIKVIIPDFKINEKLHVSILYKFDNNKCVDITIESCIDRDINVWDAVNTLMGMLEPNLFIINNSSSNHDLVKYNYLNPLLSISIYTHFNVDYKKMTAVMHVTSRYWECFGNKLNTKGMMNKIFQLYRVKSQTNHKWLKYYYFVLSIFFTSILVYSCFIYVLDKPSEVGNYKRYTLHGRYVLDNKTGNIYYINVNYPPKKVFDPSKLDEKY